MGHHVGKTRVENHLIKGLYIYTVRRCLCGQNTWFYSSVGEVDTKPNIRGLCIEVFLAYFASSENAHSTIVGN